MKELTVSEFDREFAWHIARESQNNGVSYNSALERLYEMYQNCEKQEDWDGWLDYIRNDREAI